MKIINRRLDNFLVAIHPVLRGVILLFFSYWSAGQAVEHIHNVGHLIWFALFGGVLFVAGIWYLLYCWGDTIDPKLNDLPL